MSAYEDLLRDVLEHGDLKPTRAKVRGEYVDAYSVFGRQLRFDLADGFPAVTTKKLAFGAIVHELIWFLRGESNIAYLRANKVSIWDEWADDDGELGPVYGVQWRHWPAPDGGEIDQIAQLVEGIRRVKADPRDSIGRRLIVTAWNPADIPRMALAPCHALVQMSLTKGRLSCQLYQRSADLFLGVPFNIASYALFTHLVAKVCEVEVGEFIHTFGDAHIYENHVDQVREQLGREPHPWPTLWLDPEIRDLASLRRDQIKLVDYKHHPVLTGEVAV